MKNIIIYNMKSKEMPIASLAGSLKKSSKQKISLLPVKVKESRESKTGISLTENSQINTPHSVISTRNSISVRENKPVKTEVFFQKEIKQMKDLLNNNSNKNSQKNLKNEKKLIINKKSLKDSEVQETITTPISPGRERLTKILESIKCTNKEGLYGEICQYVQEKLNNLKEIVADGIKSESLHKTSSEDLKNFKEIYAHRNSNKNSIQLSYNKNTIRNSISTKRSEISISMIEDYNNEYKSNYNATQTIQTSPSNITSNTIIPQIQELEFKNKYVKFSDEEKQRILGEINENSINRKEKYISILETLKSDMSTIVTKASDYIIYDHWNFSNGNTSFANRSEIRSISPTFNENAESKNIASPILNEDQVLSNDITKDKIEHTSQIDIINNPSFIEEYDPFASDFKRRKSTMQQHFEIVNSIARKAKNVNEASVVKNLKIDDKLSNKIFFSEETEVKNLLLNKKILTPDNNKNRNRLRLEKIRSHNRHNKLDNSIIEEDPINQTQIPDNRRSVNLVFGEIHDFSLNASFNNKTADFNEKLDETKNQQNSKKIENNQNILLQEEIQKNFYKLNSDRINFRNSRGSISRIVKKLSIINKLEANTLVEQSNLPQSASFEQQEGNDKKLESKFQSRFRESLDISSPSQTDNTVIYKKDAVGASPSTLKVEIDLSSMKLENDSPIKMVKNSSVNMNKGKSDDQSILKRNINKTRVSSGFSANNFFTKTTVDFLNSRKMSIDDPSFITKDSNNKRDSEVKFDCSKVQSVTRNEKNRQLSSTIFSVTATEINKLSIQSGVASVEYGSVYGNNHANLHSDRKLERNTSLSDMIQTFDFEATVTVPIISNYQSSINNKDEVSLLRAKNKKKKTLKMETNNSSDEVKDYDSGLVVNKVKILYIIF